jgi:hypothetical protein
MTVRLADIVDLYREGFRSMRLGRLLWKIILLKLVLLYALARFWFPDYLRTNFTSDRARAEHVMHELTRTVGDTTKADSRTVPSLSSENRNPGAMAKASGYPPARE